MNETPTPTRRVEDTVAKVDNELAVGEDLVFQRRWWAFERWIWRFFALIVLADLLGLFGRGPLANARIATPDHGLTLKYERIERFSTPSILSVQLGRAAVRDGAVHLWVSDSLLTHLGNQRISPEPAASTVVDGGILYTFAAGMQPSVVQFALEPSEIGPLHLTLRLLPGTDAQAVPLDTVQASVFVMP